jgi:branched-chain amino acid transport system substrate-binding protein
MVPQLLRLRAAQADVIFLVATVAPGAQVMKALERMEWTVPVVSHWGISGGRFPELAGKGAQHVEFIQTYSFFGPQHSVGQRVLAALQAKYPDVKGPGDVTPPVGVANAYDAMHLIALAIAKAGSTEGDTIRQGLYAIETYEGLIKTYHKPFSPDNHDALNEHDYVMVHYVGEQIEPLAQ